MRPTRYLTATIAVGLGCILLMSGGAARAQFSGPVVPPNLPIPTQGGLNTLPSNVNSSDIQKLLLLRALQQRSRTGGGGVKTGVPQFIPFGNNFMPNMMQQQMAPVVQQEPKAGGKTVEEKKAEYQAAREERKRKARERAEKRKAEAAARAKD